MYLHLNDESCQQPSKRGKIYYNLITILQNSVNLVKSKLKLDTLGCSSSTQQHNAKQERNPIKHNEETANSHTSGA